jgi:hypothetical protein
VAANVDREKKPFSTFERSIKGRVKNTTDLDLPRLSAPKSILFLPKQLTHKKVCDINDAVVQTRDILNVVA